MLVLTYNLAFRFVSEVKERRLGVLGTIGED